MLPLPNFGLPVCMDPLLMPFRGPDAPGSELQPCAVMHVTGDTLRQGDTSRCSFVFSQPVTILPLVWIKRCHLHPPSHRPHGQDQSCGGVISVADHRFGQRTGVGRIHTRLINSSGPGKVCSTLIICSNLIIGSPAKVEQELPKPPVFAVPLVPCSNSIIPVPGKKGGTGTSL